MKTSTKYLKITINLLTMLALIIFCVWALPKLIVYFMPFFIAGIVALIANPIVKFLEKKFRIVRKAGTVFVIIVVIGLLGLAAYFLIAKLVSEIIGLVSSAPKIWDNIRGTFDSIGHRYDRYLARMPGGFRGWLNKMGTAIGDALTGMINGPDSSFSENLSNFASSLPLTLVSIIMAILASYLFVAERDHIISVWKRVVPKSLRERWYLVLSTMKDAVGGYFKAQFKIMGVVYLILILGFLILGVDYALLVALLIAFLDFLPFFGTGTVMLPWALIAFFQSDYKLTVGLLIVWGVSQIVRQLIQPRMIGSSMGLEPIPTLIILYLGFRLGGALGLIVAVPVGMIIINLYKAGVFSNFAYSLKLLWHDFSRLRKFTDEEIKAEEDKYNKGG